MEEAKEQIIGLLKIFDSEEVVGILAHTAWEMYSALKREGFKEEEALQITTAWAASAPKGK